MKKKVTAFAAFIVLGVCAPAQAGLLDWVIGQGVDQFEDQIKDTVQDGIKDVVVEEVKSWFTFGGKEEETKEAPPQEEKASATPATQKSLPEKKGAAARSNLDNAVKVLPLSGKYRFPYVGKPESSKLSKGPNGGILDWFGNEWTPVYDSKGKLVAWKQYLSDVGRTRLRSTVSRLDIKKGKPLFISADGEKAMESL